MTLERRLKAQAVFEFIVASLILFAIVIYTIGYLSSSFTVHHDISKIANLESKAMRVSDMLAGDNDVGIFSEWPNLDPAKMLQLNTTCTGSDGYLNMIGKFGLNESLPAAKYNRLQILVASENNTAYIRCGRSPPAVSSSGRVVRYGYVPADGRIANITVTVW